VNASGRASGIADQRRSATVGSGSLRPVGGFSRRCLTNPDPASLQEISLGVGGLAALADSAKQNTRTGR